MRKIMEQLEKIVGEVSPRHYKDFLLAKGICGARNNGVALERLIEIAVPIMAKELKTKKQA